MMANNRFFQWIVGPRKGEVLVFDEIQSEDGVIYIKFKDNSRINESFVAQINAKNMSGKMMAEIDSPTNIWRFQEETDLDDSRTEIDANTGLHYDIPSSNEIAYADLTSGGGEVKPVPKRKKVTLIPPRPTPPNHSVFGLIKKSFDIPAQAEPEAPVINNSLRSEPQVLTKNESDPVYILMSKAKKIDSEITMGMTVSLPPVSLYNIAKESFDDGDEKFINYIVDEITVDQIKNALKTAIKQMYEESQNQNLTV